MYHSLNFKDISELKIGDCVSEIDYGQKIDCEVVSIPSNDGCDKDQLAWVMKNVDTGKKIDYLVTDGYMHYGPKLYRECND